MKRNQPATPDVAAPAAAAIDPATRAKIDAKTVENIVKKVGSGGVPTEREMRILNAATSDRQAGRPASETIRWSVDRAATEFGPDRRTMAKRLAEAGIGPGPDGKYSTKDIFLSLSGGNTRDRKDAQQTELLRVQTENAKRERVPMTLVEKKWDAALQAFAALLKAAKGKTLTPEKINELLDALRSAPHPGQMVANLDPYEIEKEALDAAFDELRTRCLARLSTVTPREFAETIMRMPDAHGATRPFTFSFAPYQLEPYLEIFNPRNIEVVLMMNSRGGKSRIVMCVIGFHIAKDPCRIAVLWPVEGHAKKWSKYDLMAELVEPTPEIAALISDSTGQRKSKETILDKPFPGGLLQALGANAPGGMRRIKAQLLVGDEIDAIQNIESDEGDQLKIFAMRAAEFADARQVYCSYPSLKGKSRIEAKLLQSDLRLWISICLKCGDEFIMHRTGVSPFGDKYLRGKVLYEPAAPHLARQECPHCKTQHDDDARFAMMMGGDPAKPRYDLWRATRPENTGRAGFHANALLWPHQVSREKFPGGFLEVLAREMMAIDSSENPERARKVLVNARDAETYQSASDVKPDHSRLFLRREAWAGYGQEVDSQGKPIALPWDSKLPVPAGVLVIVFFTDVQDDRLEMFIEGHGLNHQLWQLGKHVIKGGKGCALAQPNEGVWAQHDHLLESLTFLHPCGKTLKILGGLVDAGDKRDHVCAYTMPRARRKVYASRGDTELCRGIVEKRIRKEKRNRIWVIGTHAAKEVIYQRLDQDNPQSTGYRHYPVAPWCSETFFKRLTSENSEDRQGRDGKWYKWFGCEQGTRNEELDGAVGCMAAIQILKPKFQKLAEEYAIKIGEQPAKVSELASLNQESAREGGEQSITSAKRKGAAFAQRVSSGRNFTTGWKR